MGGLEEEGRTGGRWADEERRWTGEGGREKVDGTKEGGRTKEGMADGGVHPGGRTRDE